MGKSSILARLVAVCAVMALTAGGVSLNTAAAEETPSSTASADIAGPSPVATVTPTPDTKTPIPSVEPSPKPVTPRGDIVGPVRGVLVSNESVRNRGRLTGRLLCRTSLALEGTRNAPQKLPPAGAQEAAHQSATSV